jgi:hypothetical protein
MRADPRRLMLLSVLALAPVASVGLAAPPPPDPANDAAAITGALFGAPAEAAPDAATTAASVREPAAVEAVGQAAARLLITDRLEADLLAPWSDTPGLQAVYMRWIRDGAMQLEMPVGGQPATVHLEGARAWVRPEGGDWLALSPAEARAVDRADIEAIAYLHAETLLARLDQARDVREVPAAADEGDARVIAFGDFAPAAPGAPPVPASIRLQLDPADFRIRELVEVHGDLARPTAMVRVRHFDATFDDLPPPR